MWGVLLAAEHGRLAAPAHHSRRGETIQACLTAPAAGKPSLIATLRRWPHRRPARLIRHGGQLIQQLPPGHGLLA